MYLIISSTKHYIFDPHQFGCRKNIDTSDALNHITRTLYKLDTTEPIIPAFLELAKAFDIVHHNMLWAKLYNYGITGNVNNLKYILYNIMNVIGVFAKVKTGVPECIIPDPWFFVVYVNVILTCMSSYSILSYLDDTVVIVRRSGYNIQYMFEWNIQLDDFNPIELLWNCWYIIRNYGSSIPKHLNQTWLI